MESIFFKECEIPQYLTMYQFHHLSQFPLSPCRWGTWIRRLGTNSTKVSKAFCQHVRPSPKRIRTGEIDSSSHGWKVFQGTDVWSSQSSMNLNVSCQGLWRVWEICIQLYIQYIYIYKNQIVCLKKKDRKSKKFVSHWKRWVIECWLKTHCRPFKTDHCFALVYLHGSVCGVVILLRGYDLSLFLFRGIADMVKLDVELSSICTELHLASEKNSFPA